jgi:AraC family transcriptional regulator
MGCLIVAESRYSPFFRTPSHWHETASFTAVCGGGYREEFAHRQFECGVGGTLYRPAGSIHRDHIGSDGAHCLMVEMPEEWIGQMAVKGLNLSVPWHAPWNSGFAARIRRELMVADELSPLAVEAMVIEVACAWQRDELRRGTLPRWLRLLRERIAAEFAELPQLGVLAEELGVHPGHMARAFRRHLGCTIGEYARRRKIAYCCEQLRHSHASLCDIAAEAGFSSQAHMARVFKLQTSMTPAEFRRLRVKM